MAETSLNKRVMRALRGLHPMRVENVVCPGCPDINYIGGWIENKQLPRWPRQGSIVKVDHFTPQQRCWHRMRAIAGGVSYVCIQIDRTVLLLRGHDAAVCLGNCTEQRLREIALGVWENRLDDKEFVAKLVTE